MMAKSKGEFHWLIQSTCYGLCQKFRFTLVDSKTNFHSLVGLHLINAPC